MIGTLTVFCGPMFSGKTESLITKLRTFVSQGTTVSAIKPIIDNRYPTGDVNIISHTGKTFPARAIEDDPQILSAFCKGEIIGIDEVQFFGPWILGAIQELQLQGKHVVASGLDLTYKGEPFGMMPELLCFADEVRKLRAKCAKCGCVATRTVRTASEDTPTLVGGAEAYEPRCFAHFG
jgi:thymidine kinase